jgi:hypothetical protein
MKIIISILILLFPVVSVAQTPRGINQADMQDMMQLMQKMQECMSKIDKSKLEVIEQQSEKFATELESLCKQGKRKEAQKKAIAFGKDMMENPALKQMKECGEITKGLGAERSMPSFEDEFDFSNRHVCDE